MKFIETCKIFSTYTEAENWVKLAFDAGYKVFVLMAEYPIFSVGYSLKDGIFAMVDLLKYPEEYIAKNIKEIEKK